MAPGAAAAAVSQPFSLGDMRNSAMARPTTQKDATPETYRKFEGMVLATFVQSMLPKEAGTVYGEGMSGDMWKSLLSQQLGTVMADRGGIGIADSLLKDHYQDGDTKVALSAVSSGPEKAQHDQRLNLSAAMVQELQRRLTSDIAGDTSPATDAR
jgi:Rod binding domain-containing protein